MIQGVVTGTAGPGPGYCIKGEIHHNGFDNPLNMTGVFLCANWIPDSAALSFYK